MMIIIYKFYKTPVIFKEDDDHHDIKDITQNTLQFKPKKNSSKVKLVTRPPGLTVWWAPLFPC